MKQASKALNADALTPIIEHNDRGAYDIPRCNGLYSHPQTGIYYIRHDRWSVDSIGSYGYRARWYKANKDEAEEAHKILAAWNTGREPSLTQTNAELWEYFVDYQSRNVD